MIELFSRKFDAINLPAEAILTPLPIDEAISSLSAILLNQAYYDFLRQGRVIVEGITVLDAAHLIPFKAKAWLDLTKRKRLGEKVDSKNIRKHKNDVFRLTELLNLSVPINTPKEIYDDINLFLELISKEEIQLEQLGIIGKSKESIFEEIRKMYVIKEYK